MLEQVKRIGPSGDPIRKYLNPYQVLAHLWRFRSLIGQLTRREIVARYKGSFVGMGWSVIHPLMMLGVYTFVFSVIFNARWGIGSGESRASFALTLFMGMVTFSVFSEAVNSAPTLILRHANYVKKVIFPLETLPAVGLLSALVNSLFGLGVLLLGMVLTGHPLFWTALLLPLVWLPLILFTLGCSFFLSALGVFIRDIGATVGVVTTMLLFLTPIFYPLKAVPEEFRVFSMLNPLALFVENSRRVVLWGSVPDWPLFFLSVIFSLLVFTAGFLWFMKSKRGFPDVV
jgi:lipopolysaccharide transport system permease protein